MRVLKVDFFAVEKNSPAVLAKNPAKYLCQCALAGPVFSNQSMNMTSLDIKADGVECLYSGKDLVNPF